VTVRDATSGALAEKVLPESLGMSPERLLLRAYAVNEGASVKLGCQAFPVPASPSDVPGTLRAVTSASTLTATVADPLYADGDVGVFVRGVQLTLESIDVLTP
jgi:hypothetical protein